MYIEPNTTIKLYSGVPLDNTYTNSLYFADISQQREYFDLTNKLKYTLANNTYQRVERGRMRIEKKADELYDCNYLAFQNTNYGNKWFYAFITGVEFVNNVTSEITFEIDTIQTYMFDIELKDSFVVREHSTTDEIGDNIVAEGISIGEYVESDYSDVEENLFRFDDANVCVMVSRSSLPEGHQGVAVIDGIISGFGFYIFRIDDGDAINGLIEEYQTAGHPEDILLMFMSPKYLYPDVPDGGILIEGSHQYQGINVYATITLNGDETFGSYVPKNKKLYTYPYNFLNLSDGGNNTLALRFEFFEKNVNNSISPKVRIDTSLMPPVKLVVRPVNYKGMTSRIIEGGIPIPEPSRTESLTIEGYPYASWNYDFYKTWLAQHAMSQIISTATNVGGAVMSMVSGNISTGVGSIVGTAASLMTSDYEASIHADVVRGNSTNGNVNYSNNMLHLWYSRFHITEEYARIVDNYFTMYGYATNKVKTPSFANRPHWTYVKTNGCVAIGQAPSDEIRRFCSIIDNGITFWTTPSEVGDYSLDNSPE